MLQAQLRIAFAYGVGTTEIFNVEDGADDDIRALVISADGKTVAGINYDENSTNVNNSEFHLFTWTQETGLVTSSFAQHRPLGMSANGDKIIGSFGNKSFLLEDGEVRFLDGTVSNGITTTKITGISSDGSTLIGTGSGNFTAEYNAGQASCCSGGLIWTEEEGNILISGFAPLAVSGDGQIVVGYAIRSVPYGQTRTRNKPAIWDRTNGLRFLDDILSDRGIDFSPVDLSGGEADRRSKLTGISDDGLYLFGEDPDGEEFVISNVLECSVTPY